MEFSEMLDGAADLFGQGVAAARDAMGDKACESLGFVRALRQLCYEGSQAGYHERNGGNASYILSDQDIHAASSFFRSPGPWLPLAFPTAAMGGSYLLVTAAGCYLKNVAVNPVATLGIVELSPDGAEYRTVWGFKGDGRPTSELSAHVACHGARRSATAGRSRVLYHAHPASVVALTALVEPDARALTNILWRSLTESLIAFPQGLGALPWMVPGSASLAQATAEQLMVYPACLWQLHGVFASGETADEAFGLVQAIDKAASTQLALRSAASGNPASAFQLSDDDLLSMAEAYDLPVNKSFL